MFRSRKDVICILALAAYIAVCSFCVGGAAITSISKFAKYYSSGSILDLAAALMLMVVAIIVAAVGAENVESIYRIVGGEGEKQ